MKSINSHGAIALLFFALAPAGCGGDDPGTDAGPMTGTDAGPMTGTDAGPMTGTDAGPMTGTDAGPMFDAGPPDMNAQMREGAAVARIRALNCGCDMGVFPSAAACESFSVLPELTACSESAYTTHFSTVGGFFTCSATAREAYATCIEAAGCDDLASGDCQDVYDAESMFCGGFVTSADGMAYQATFEMCADTSIVGTGGTCPDDSGAISTTGASVFTGSTVAAGSDLDAPSGCITAMGGGGSPDRALRWSAPSAGAFVFDTMGSNFDTVLYVLSGCDAAMSLGCNDDISDMDLRSSVTATLTMGQEVLVVVEGFSDVSAGDFVVNINAM